VEFFHPLFQPRGDLGVFGNQIVLFAEILAEVSSYAVQVESLRPILWDPSFGCFLS
jgi:hypothetical protein